MLRSFTSFWDGHRQTVRLAADGTKLNLGTLALAILWLKLAPALPSSAKLLLRVIVVTTTASLVLALLSFIPPSQLPSTLLVLMPGRLLNFGAFIAVSLLIGLLGHAWLNRPALWSRLLALYLSIGLLISRRSMLWELMDRPESGTKPPQILLTVALVLIVMTIVSRTRSP